MGLLSDWLAEQEPEHVPLLCQRWAVHPRALELFLIGQGSITLTTALAIQHDTHIDPVSLQADYLSAQGHAAPKPKPTPVKKIISPWIKAQDERRTREERALRPRKQPKRAKRPTATAKRFDKLAQEPTDPSPRDPTEFLLRSAPYRSDMGGSKENEDPD